jgi:crotonobetainyl-CoA:carnitine CoA-transferase CaiB-like acyl-CoA transferase
VQQPSIAAGFRLTETADGFVAMVTVTDKQWIGLMRAAGLDDLLEDPDFATITARMRNAGRAMSKVGAVFRELGTEEVLRRTLEHDVPCMPALALDQVRHHEQVIAAATIEELDHPVLGRIAQPRPAARFLDETRPPVVGVGQPGHDTDAVLRSLGLGAHEIEDLRARQVVG